MRARRVGVVGGGTMGAGIAAECLRAGLDVRIVGSGPASADRARTRVLGLLDRAQAKGRIDDARRASAEERAVFGADPDALADRDFVIEAVTEDRETKLRLFTALGKTVEDPEAVLASTTSSFAVADLAAATDRRGYVIGLHFFNPVPTMPLVEVIRSAYTTDRTAARAEELITEVLGKEIVRAEDRCGFVVNALLIPYLMAAVRMYESGVATAEDIDRGMTLGCGHPMGPLAVLDLIGLDVIADVARSMEDGTGDPRHAVPPLLDRLIGEGRLGRKTGHGFHRYDTVRAAS
ncbi:3-hydroxybutyryl-CoA dehydrogenase [Streptomyces shenzhenensis]|uniref:3-hydroxybutyryl-CoA dehydrogenase n=1 Tax=Streptomyces shenzhenensis TaxID=943815 RepID=UPI001EE9AF89|nr:3-hydroxybutyryl-CoA dehydrogenase [Streptomyces shenzhenensis]